MRQLAVLATSVPLLGACSFIYNPDHINRDIDAQTADVEIVTDVDPTMLTIDDVVPDKVNEGAGTGNASPAVFVIYGHQIAPDATVTITPTTDDAALVSIVAQQVAADANFIAFTLQVNDDGMQNDGVEHPIGITVTQSGGAVTRSLDPMKLVVHHLDSLTTTISAPPARKLYSLINVTDVMTFPPDATLGAIQLRAVGPATVTKAITAKANGTLPGPGGCAGGAMKASGASSNASSWPCQGRGESLGGGLLNNVGGGGGGFAVAGENGSGPGGSGGIMCGTREIDAFSNNAPSGGGGGGAASVLGSASAAGGGGGMIEISAGGDLTVGAGINANGADGTGGGGGDGGGGAGGVILLRAGATISVTGALTVNKGLKGTGGAAGGDGSVGRIRIDAAKGSLPDAGYNAPMFIDPPRIVTAQHTSLMLRGFPGDMTASYTVFDRDGNRVDGPQAIAFGTDQATQPVTLKAGYNKVCLVVKNGNVQMNPEAGQCTDIAFLP